MKHIASLALTLALAVFCTASIAQHSVQNPSTINLGPFSPSITSFKIDASNEGMICAYAYSPGASSWPGITGGVANQRKVAITRSTDGGNNWSTPITLSNATYPSMDDPQILSLGGGVIVCVVKAWANDNNSTAFNGQGTNQFGWREGYDNRGATLYYGDLYHTIFLESAILMAVSTDNGLHWSGDGSSPTPRAWQTIKTNGFENGGCPKSTVEHPRIAFRPGFDNKGYIVWQHKTWSLNGDWSAFDADSNGSSHAGYRITNSEIGICAFKSDGTLYAGGDYMPSSINNSIEVSHSWNIDPGPELPSVAISPEGTIWLAYNHIKYWFDKDGNFSKDVWWGLRAPVAYLYVVSASCEVSSGSPVFTYATPQEVVHDNVMGFYNAARGYLYASVPDDKTNIPSLANYDGELASGPSIQVACANPRNCSAPYTVGVVQAWGDGRQQSSFTATPADGIAQSWLSFIRADVHRFGGVSEWWGTSTSPNSTLNFTKTATHKFDGGNPYGDQVDFIQVGSTAPSKTANYTMHWFPTLKYVTAPDGFESFYPDENIQPSFFALSWRYGFCASASDMHTAKGNFDSLLCRTAVSFDNHAFQLTSSSSTHFIRSASAVSSANTPGPDFWGTKMDIAGDGGLFQVHPTWRDPVNAATSGNVEVNTGGCILIRPYIQNYPPANAFALPIVDFATLASTGFTTYKLVGQFTMGSLPSLAKSDVTCNDISPFTAQHTYLPAVTTTNFPTGIFEALYNTYPDNLVGDLGMSHQRRLVMTGNIVHAVGFDAPHAGMPGGNKIWYCNRFSPSDGTSTDWSPRDEIANGSNLGPPSIAVYQESATGKKAIAVAWETADPTPNSVKRTYTVKVKEMSNSCDDGNWSEPVSFSYDYVFGSHIWKPVIAPLTYKDPLHPNNRLLLGWTIVYPDFNSVDHNTLLRGGQANGTRLMNNEHWGDYNNIYQSSSWTGDETVASGLKYGLSSTGTTVAVTSNENNGNLSDVSQEVVWTGSGYSTTGGVWDLNVSYDISDGTNLGNLAPDWIHSTMATPRFPAQQSIPQILGDKVWIHRNPSVVISSVGQKHVAWEQMESPSSTLPLLNQPIWRSSITLSYTTKLSVSGVPDAWSPVKDLKVMRTPNPDDIGRSFSFLRNPSLTAFPRTSRVWSSSTTIGDNKDPETAELLYWMEDTAGYTKNGVLNWLSNAGNPLGGVFPPHSNLHAYIFNRDNNKATYNGDWKTSEIGNNASSITDPNPPHRTVPIFPWPPHSDAENLATNAHRSFGPYTDGPSFNHVDPNLNYYGLESYAAGNDGRPTNWMDVVTPEVGTKPGLKIGTYNSPLATNMYRSEIRAKGNSVVEFKWGNAYVEDSALNLATREIILHHGEEDTNGYGTANAIRDSIFQTEWFNWPVSASINYDRLMLFANAGYFDTVSCGDSLYPCYDSVMHWHADTLTRTDSGFIAPATKMTYTVELVHKSSGRIDTVDRMTYNPMGMKYIQPLTVHLANATYNEDTVMLRVRGDFMGIPENDTSFEFNREMMYGTYPIQGDTVIAVGGGGIIAPDTTGCLQVIGPYPNPSHTSTQNVSILMSYCHAGQTVTVQVFDGLGNPIGDPVSITSDGHSWDRVQIPAPSTSGAYFIHINAGFLSTTLPYSVTP